MDLNRIATPYGLGAIGAVCALAGFVVYNGVYRDKDDKVLKTGSKNHPRTLDQFQNLCAGVAGTGEEIREMRGLFDSTRNDIKVLADALRKVQMDRQKQLFRDRDQRESERMVAGLRYIETGGNGETRAGAGDFARDHRDLYEAAVLAAPELKLDTR